MINFKWYNIVMNKWKGETNMKLRRELSGGRKLEHLSFDEIDKEASDSVSEGDRLGELASRFLADKNKLVEALKVVDDLEMEDEDKKQMRLDIVTAIEALQEQYDQEVTAEEERIHSNISEQIEQIDCYIEELHVQSDSLREITMDAASIDASAAADAADEKRNHLEKMKAIYTEKLSLQMAKAEIIRREIQSRRY